MVWQHKELATGNPVVFRFEYFVYSVRGFAVLWPGDMGLTHNMLAVVMYILRCEAGHINEPI